MKHIALNYTFAALSLLALCLSSKAQTVAFKKDTGFLVYCYGTLENGRPVVNSFVCKDLNFFKELIQIKNEDEFLCSFFKNSVAYVDASITMYKHEAQYNFSNKEESVAFHRKLAQQISFLTKSQKNFISPRFSNNKILTFSISKLAGEFWMDRVKPDYIYPLSESFTISPECYNYNYLYYLKQVDKIYKLDDKDMSIIQTLLIVAEKRK